MIPRRRSELPVGIGAADIPYDQSGGDMPGMSVPEPGGTMKKMQFEFTDPAEAAAQQAPQIPPGAGVLPAGAQAAPAMPEGAQPAQQAPPEQPQGLLAGLAPQMGGMSQGPDTSMLTEEDLAGLVQDPNEIMGQDMSQGALSGDPMLQEQLLEAARRQLMGGGGY